MGPWHQDSAPQGTPTAPLRGLQREAGPHGTPSPTRAPSLRLRLPLGASVVGVGGLRGVPTPQSQQVNSWACRPRLPSSVETLPLANGLAPGTAQQSGLGPCDARPSEFSLETPQRLSFPALPPGFIQAPWLPDKPLPALPGQVPVGGAVGGQGAPSLSGPYVTAP